MANRRELRKLGLSHRKIGALVDRSHTTIRRILNGQGQHNAETVSRVRRVIEEARRAKRSERS